MNKCSEGTTLGADTEANLSMPISTALLPSDDRDLPVPFPPLLAGGLSYSETQRQQASASHLRRVAQVLKERYSRIPFYSARAAKEGEKYWLDLAASAPNILPGNPYKI